MNFEFSLSSFSFVHVSKYPFSYFFYQQNNHAKWKNISLPFIAYNVKYRCCDLRTNRKKSTPKPKQTLNEHFNQKMKEESTTKKNTSNLGIGTIV